jgi:hypothetical protein
VRLFAYVDWKEIQTEILYDFNVDFGKHFLNKINSLLPAFVHEESSICIILVVSCEVLY